MFNSIKISNVLELDDVYKFTLSGLNVSVANALRRIILSEIPINVIRTETEQINQCKFKVNTSRLHNEILKHRLSCIPIHSKRLDYLPDNYILEVDVENDTDSVMYVTTEHFKIKNKSDPSLVLSREETQKIFPQNKLTGYYIDFVRLRPRIGEQIPGEKVSFVADFSISNARENSMFNVVSICTYCNTLDADRIQEEWDKIQAQLIEKNETKEEIAFKKKNYYALDAQRIYIENSFDFSIQSIGIYTNTEIVKLGCQILKNKFHKMVQQIDTNSIIVTISNTALENAFDIILEDEDYTIGKVIEYILYEKHYLNKELSFCGFKKSHPHDTFSKIRVAFYEPVENVDVLNMLKEACVEGEKIFEHINRLF